MSQGPITGGFAARATQAAHWLRRPELLIFLPAITLAGFWYGGEHMLTALAVGLPFLYAMTGAFSLGPRNLRDGDRLTDLPLRSHVLERLDALLAAEPRTGRGTACLVLQLDEADLLVERHGRAAQVEILARGAERLIGALRDGDVLVRLEGGGFAVALGPSRRVDIETLIQISTRLQQAFAVPTSIDGLSLFATASVGFCLSGRAPSRSGKGLLDAAQLAADEASAHGPGGIRCYASDMTTRRSIREATRADLETALDSGQIFPYFQPQISTETGAVTGIEALARWQHPERGLIAPGEFLPLIAEAGLSERLGEVILFHSLSALGRLDRSGPRVPAVAVNFCGIELRNPRLAETLKWELDRFDLTPDRLAIEVLETVVADADNDIVVTNLNALARLGCRIDLDDFGTGHAGIANIRRFAVGRLKIDRSFVTGIDADPSQQEMVSAILSLAERLSLDTIAEGVETPAQHAILSQLGCGHVQGFGIARPMPLEDLVDWVARRGDQPTRTPRIGHRAR